MPTGYTADITDTMPFRDFAMKCARAMGALIMMRDDPSDAPIPEAFEPSTYHAENIAKADARLKELDEMDAAAKERGAREEFMAASKAHAESLAKSRGTRRRYERMLREVNDWKPPTPDHQGFKDFMVQQLTESIRFDCWEEGDSEWRKPPKHLGPGDWWAKEVDKANRDLVYHRREHTAEVERATMRTKWVKDLRASLGIAAHSPLTEE